MGHLNSRRLTIAFATLLVVPISILAYQFVTATHGEQRVAAAMSILVVALGLSLAWIVASAAHKSLRVAVEARTRELQESRDRLVTALNNLETAYAFQQSIIDGIAEPILVIGTDYQVKLLNRAARELRSIDREASDALLCHRQSHDRDTPCSGPGDACPLDLVRASGRTVTVTHDHVRAGGERRIMEVVASPLRGPNGEFEGIVEATRDVTERKWVEDALAQQAASLDHSNEELEQLTYRLMESVQSFLEKLPEEGGPDAKKLAP
jgi:PAS domain-containing protein